MKDFIQNFEIGTERYQPDPKHNYFGDPNYVLDQQFLARLVGTVALGLPFVMLFASAIGACSFDSISHYYYSWGFGGVLVAALVIIGTFLIAYRGENSKESKLATFAGICAFFVALLPTEGRGCEKFSFSSRILADLTATSKFGPVTVSPATDPGHFFQLFPGVGILHFGSAALLFMFLAYYSFFVFTRVIKNVHLTKGGELTRAKTTRNWLYTGSGVVIVFCILAMAANALNTLITKTPWEWWTDYNATFWFEAFALWAFGFSWMVKGRFYGKWLLDHRDQRG